MDKEFKFTSSTGKDVYARMWANDNIKEYKGIVQLVHGMQEHIGRYVEFANVLADCGYIVVGHDHLGHGNTVKNEDEFGHFADKEGWNRLVDDIHILQNQIQKE